MSSLNNRGSVARRTPPIAAPRLPTAAEVLTPTCIVETFDGADSGTIGPDLSWDQDGYSAGGVGGVTPVAGGAHVKDNQCSLYAPASSPGVGKQWISSTFVARTVDAFGDDMAVSADVLPAQGQPVGTPGNLINADCTVLARMETETLDIANSSYVGFFASAVLQGISSPTYFWRIKLGWETASYSASATNYVYSVTGAPPSSIGLTVTGEDATLALTAYADGSPVISWNYADIIADGFTDILDDPSYLPRGQRSGFYLFANVDFASGGGITTGSFHDHDDEVGIDNFEVCPV